MGWETFHSLLDAGREGRLREGIFNCCDSMKRRWNIRSSFSGTETLSVSPIEQLLLLRGIDSEEGRRKFLSPDYDEDLHDPFLFSDMEKIISRVGRAIDKSERVGVFGDYDADGVTSSAILRRGLERLGLQVSPYIPDKLTEGHGLHCNALDAFEREGIRLVFTVDCGMMNHSEIADAVGRDMDVIVIDHHHVPEELPKAFAIVNPKFPDSPYPFHDLCGAGTTFRVVDALYRRFLPDARGELKWLLDLVAIGTVADCVPLVGENRVLVKYGLVVLSKTRTVGLREMFQVGGIAVSEDQMPNAETISFQIGPRINAASRMAHAKTAHDLLMTELPAEARLLALELEAQNRSRQKTSEALAREVRTVAEQLFRNKKFIFAVGEHYSFGVAGLVAGKIANELGKPTAVFSKGETESIGSFRSIPSLSIIEAIGECADLLEKFGGHSQAAGATVRNDKLEAFFEKLEQVINRRLSETVVEPVLDIDLELSPRLLTGDLARGLRRLEPFGIGNPEPTFLVRGAIVREVRLVGNGEKHLKLSFSTDGGVFGGIGFGMGEEWGKLIVGDRVDVVFRFGENQWNGSSRLEWRVLDMAVSEQ